MYKRVAVRPEWLRAPLVRDLYSVSSCVSHDFCDWIDLWQHNGYWFFNSLKVMDGIIQDLNLDAKAFKAFYYRIYPYQWQEEWGEFEIEKSFTTDIEIPEAPTLEGFDVVTYNAQTSAECSPLSCNGLAQGFEVNAHCLVDDFDVAKNAVENGYFNESEPGPYRIIEVNSFAA